MPNLLLTGGRAPATLELARLFHAAGWQVFVAESIPWHVCRWSRAVRKSYRLPPPNRQPHAYIQTLADIILEAQIDLLLPTCEEIFFIAKGLNRLTPLTTVFCQPLDKLIRLHHKWLFNQRAKQHGLSVPESWLVTHHDDLSNLPTAPADLVLKPVFSRFGNQTLIQPTSSQLDSIRFRPNNPWVAQQFISGRQICTYSVAHEGQLTAHAAYRTEWLAQKAAVLFEAVQHDASFEWATRFVAAESFSGQIGFDFIETEVGQLFAIECNPRTTSGAHLFRAQPAFPQAFCQPHSACLYPLEQPPILVSLAMLLYTLPTIRSWGRLRRWLKIFLSSQDAVYRATDRGPAVAQMFAVGQLFWWGVRYGISPTEATTFDIAWNGE